MRQDVPSRKFRAILFQDAVCTDAEFTCGTHRINGCVFHLARRHERFKHPADNERVNQHFLPVQFTGLCACDDDGMMLHDVLCLNTVPWRGKVNRTGILAELLAGQHLFHDRRQHVIYILWQQATGGARIGNQLLLVQALCNLLHLYGRQAVVTVRIFLQFGQVVKCRCPDFLRPFPYRCDAGTLCRLAILVQCQCIPADHKVVHVAHL